MMLLIHMQLRQFYNTLFCSDSSCLSRYVLGRVYAGAKCVRAVTFIDIDNYDYSLYV